MLPGAKKNRDINELKLVTKIINHHILLAALHDHVYLRDYRTIIPWNYILIIFLVHFYGIINLAKDGIIIPKKLNKKITAI